MQMLIVQTLGLLVGAYFVGAFCGCLLRRVFFVGRPKGELATVAVPAVAEDAATMRFVEALGGPATRTMGTPAPASPAPAAVTPVKAQPAQAPTPAAVAPAPSAPFASGTLPSAGGSTGQGSVAAAIAMAAASPAASPAAAASASDDLTLIRAIDQATVQKLAALGVTRFSEIAAWRATDIASVSTALGTKGRIAAENWVEQAQILAKGGLTRYAREQDGRVPVGSPAGDQGAPKPIAPAASVAVPRVEERAAFAEPSAPVGDVHVGAAATAAVVAAAAQLARMDDRMGLGLGRDDLKRIAGISSEVEKTLNAQDITRFSQIAAWTAADAARIDGLLGRDGRVAAENWIAQAQILTAGGATAYANEKSRQDDVIRPARLVDAIREPAVTQPAQADTRDLSVLRSVRSEIYRGGELGPKPEIDDLKRIRGVGVLIEKRLASLGVTSYEQVANWSASDVDRISEALDFKGRIERENWVEQARILASGGQTEFSRRVDRGEVESSRARSE